MPVFSIAFAAFLASAQPQASSGGTADEIVVTGQRKSTLDLARLRRAERRFLQDRPAFAPAASLFFEVVDRPDMHREGMRLELRTVGRTIPLLIDTAGRFALPAAAPGRWDLVHNRGQRRIAIRPVVFSPGTSDSDRRLGDLRLQCRLMLDLMDANFMLKAAFRSIGGCTSSRVGIYVKTSRLVRSATVVQSGTSQLLGLGKDRMSYGAPLSDRNLSNAARVQVIFE